MDNAANIGKEGFHTCLYSRRNSLRVRNHRAHCIRAGKELPPGAAGTLPRFHLLTDAVRQRKSGATTRASLDDDLVALCRSQTELTDPPDAASMSAALPGVSPPP